MQLKNDLTPAAYLSLTKNASEILSQIIQYPDKDSYRKLRLDHPVILVY